MDRCRHCWRILFGLCILQQVLKILLIDNPVVLSTLHTATDIIYAEDLIDASFRTNTDTNILDTKVAGIPIPAQGTSASASTSTSTSTSTSKISADKSIRKWGCSRSETPLIFVHIGKAGGGGARIRLAAAAIDYDRKHWSAPENDEHYFPIRTTGENNDYQKVPVQPSSFRKGRFCNSKYSHPTLIPPNNKTAPVKTEKPYEGLKHCNATTPFGVAIACPVNYMSMSSFKSSKGEPKFSSALCQGCDDDYYLMQQFYANADSLKEKISAGKKLLDPPPSGHTCDTVYVSHNNVGNELSWLPPRYLKEHWWDKSVWKQPQISDHAKNGTTATDTLDEMEFLWESLLDDRKRRRTSALRNENIIHLIGRWNKTVQQALRDDLRVAHQPPTEAENEHRWCPHGYRTRWGPGGRKRLQRDRPAVTTVRWGDTKNRYENCVKPIAEKADKTFERFWNEQQRQRQRQLDDHNNVLNVEDPSNYSPIYASMPLHRVTMLRDPWSWIVSKYFWHPQIPSLIECHDVTARYDHASLGWVAVQSLLFLFQLCGNDCLTRYENGFVTLEQIEAQVESNLRNAFSVVGLLHESDSFYDMIDKRIEYIDTKRLFQTNRTRNHHEEMLLRLLSEPLHMSGGDKKTKDRCNKLFLEDETFREEVRRTVPEFAILERIYHVGIEVNRFHKDELSRC